MQKVIKFIERITKEYEYKPLPSDKSKLARDWYAKHLPVLDPSQPIYDLQGHLIAESFTRIVIGDYGAFIEFNNKQANHELFSIAKGQEFRFQPWFKGKYKWLTTNGANKIYLQLRGVSYADYKADMFYISPYEVRQ